MDRGHRGESRHGTYKVDRRMRIPIDVNAQQKHGESRTNLARKQLVCHQAHEHMIAELFLEIVD